MLCTQTPGGVPEDEYVEMLLDRQVSGIVFVSGLHADSTSDPERYRKLLARPLPIVLINGFAEGIEAPFISCDDRAAGELAVSHLAALGHQRIGLITGPDRYFPVQAEDRGLPGGDAAGSGSEECRSRCHCSASRAATRPRPACWTRG